MRDAVRKLDRIDREVLLLREFEQLSYAEIAEAAGRSLEHGAITAVQGAHGATEPAVVPGPSHGHRGIDRIGGTRMTVAAQHAFAPEDIMAWLDGELSAAEADEVSAHIENCAECTVVVEQFRERSRWLAGWSIAPAPDTIDAAVTVQPVKAAKRRMASKPTRSRAGGWWLWALGSGSVVALAILLTVHSISNSAGREIARRSMASMSQQSENAPVYMAQRAPALAASRKREAGIAGVERDDSLQVTAPRQGIARMNNGALTNPTAVTAASPSAGGPMIARRVALIIVVKDAASARIALDGLLAHYQGYAAQLDISTPEESARSFGASLRIPAPQLGAALADLRRLGRVQNESQSGEEVTEQHADLVARLRNARETEQRLLAIMQQRTGKVEEILQVEEQISNTRGEIERMEAEQKELEHRVDFATISLQVNEVYKAELAAPSSFSVGARMHNSFVAGLSSAGRTVLGILLFCEEYGLVLLVWLVVLGTPLWFLWRRYRRAMRNI